VRYGEASVLCRNVVQKDPGVLLSVGMICLAGAILLKRFGGGSRALAFVEGMLIGVSLVFNVTYLILVRRRRDPKG
jgi:hypothetical protein